MATVNTTYSNEPSQQELRRDILGMIWPVAIENVLQMLIGFVNTGMVGRLGAATILAVGLSSRVATFVWIIFSAIGTGTTVLIARAIGADDNERVERIAQQALLVALSIVLVVVAVVFIFAPSFLKMLKATVEALPIGSTYLRILVFSMPFQALFMIISSILRGTGNTRAPMQIAFIINLVNVAVNSVLIFGHLGLPALGFRGAAVGTIIGQAVGACIAAWYLFSGRSGIGIRIRDSISIDGILIRNILGIGVPASTETLFWQLSTVVLVRLINEFGTVAGAAHQLGIQAEGISYMPTAGFAIAATTFVSRSLGGRNSRLAERYVREILRWGLILTSFSTAFLLFAPKFLMRILTDDVAVVALGAQYLILMGLSQIPQQIAGTLSGALRGGGDTITPMVAVALGVWVIRIPFSYLLSQYFNLGVHGVWWAINVDQYIRAIIIGWRYSCTRWHQSQERLDG